MVVGCSCEKRSTLFCLLCKLVVLQVAVMQEEAIEASADAMGCLFDAACKIW